MTNSPYGTTSSATSGPMRFKREMTRHPGRPPFLCSVEKEYKFDGQGGFAPNSGKIPPLDAALYVGGTVAAIWAALRFAFWIWG